MFLKQVKLWWQERLRFWRNKKILTQLAREFAKHRIDIRFGTLDENLAQLRHVHEVDELLLTHNDLFVADPFGRFKERYRAEG